MPVSRVGLIMNNHQAPPIENYCYIGDCHSAALISLDGSIDWCCMPRIDSNPCFSRLLGWENGGYCQIVPQEKYRVKRRYLEDTMILETHFTTKSGKAKVYDFFPMRIGGKYFPYQQIIRIVEGVQGKVKFHARIAPVFDFGTAKPWIRLYKRTAFSALGGDNGLLISGDMGLSIANRFELAANFSVKKGERRYLAIQFNKPVELDDLVICVPSKDELDFRLEETKEWWKNWVVRCKFTGPYAAYILRSALVLKSLSHAPTGAIAAAPTTSLPEAIGGTRNWDYRYSWIRDSVFTVITLTYLGYELEADKFRRFIERTCSSNPAGLQTLFGVAGERRLHEYEIKELSGYHNSGPVRIGNAAESQFQLDMYGYLLLLAHQGCELGKPPTTEYWKFLVQILNYLKKYWRKPEAGIWEVRSMNRQFTYSKVLCWAAFDRGICLARKLKQHAFIESWKKERDDIRRWINNNCIIKEKGIYAQSPDSTDLDASLLLLPFFGFISYKSKRMIRTTEAIRKELALNGLLRRYPDHTDGFESSEGAFISCSFWLVTCLANQGRHKLAKKIFRQTLKTSNDLKLFSEEYDPKQKRMLGNFPQALTHLSLIGAAMTLHRHKG